MKTYQITVREIKELKYVVEGEDRLEAYLKLVGNISQHKPQSESNNVIIANNDVVEIKL
jgi:hypothetical protein